MNPRSILTGGLLGGLFLHPRAELRHDEFDAGVVGLVMLLDRVIDRGRIFVGWYRTPCDEVVIEIESRVVQDRIEDVGIVDVGIGTERQGDELA
ncbi:MAG TPA: hypothetical protein VLA12_14855, partial [Planctomycetaceae bacterium]|nr:hypothetical protein [Planctomycetaceae bacterium]